MGWVRLILVCLLLLPGILVASPVYAAQSINITIIAKGWIVGAPEGFTVYYITDNSVGINWTMPTGAVSIMVRAAYGHVPTSITDGYQVYYGSGNNTVDTAATINSAEILYYNAWAQTAAGTYGDPIGRDTGGFMSVSFLFLGLLGLALTLTIASFRWKDLLLSVGTALTWLAIGFWWILGGLDNFSINNSWVAILIFIPFIMAFVVLLQLMNYETMQEQRGREGKTSWIEHGDKPKLRVTSAYEKYKTELRRRTRR